MTSSAMQKICDFVDCSGATQDPDQLRYLAAQNGYLYFPGLLPVEDVLAVRRAILHIADRHSLLRAGLDVDERLVRIRNLCILAARDDEARTTPWSTSRPRSAMRPSLGGDGGGGLRHNHEARRLVAFSLD